ncbi:MAG: YbaK/EbsC family protein [Alphaproteobacteria bacterium]|nr:MAG: YbaK/EbsC family protein [Alphaproteobacteria bacterium]
MSALPPSAQRVQDAAAALGLAVTVREMAQPTRTAEEAASACGVSVGQIVKSLVFLGATGGKPYLLLVSGANRVNEKAVAVHLGENLTRPDAGVVRALTGYAIGGIPPFGHDTALATYMDRDLLAYEMIWAAAGTPKAVFRTEPAALRDAAKAIVIDVR